ncbi:MAG TPA: hypothetical protein VGP55_12300 [Chitinophagaceae bacterium]|nr:hypothetical protein [Chitinophagaceae bacterium]
MKFKILISALLVLLVHENVFSQMMLSARIQKKETEKIRVDDAPAIVTFKKSDYKDVCNFDVILEEKNASSAYKRTIELTDGNGSRLYASDESGENPGVYKMDLSVICKKISSQTIIKIMLLENPANDLMMLPSKMKQLAEIHLK